MPLKSGILSKLHLGPKTTEGISSFTHTSHKDKTKTHSQTWHLSWLLHLNTDLVQLRVSQVGSHIWNRWVFMFDDLQCLQSSHMRETSLNDYFLSWVCLLFFFSKQPIICLSVPIYMNILCCHYTLFPTHNIRTYSPIHTSLLLYHQNLSWGPFGHIILVSSICSVKYAKIQWLWFF